MGECGIRQRRVSRKVRRAIAQKIVAYCKTVRTEYSRYRVLEHLVPLDLVVNSAASYGQVLTLAVQAQFRPEAVYTLFGYLIHRDFVRPGPVKAFTGPLSR